MLRPSFSVGSCFWGEIERASVPADRLAIPRIYLPPPPRQACERSVLSMLALYKN